jgi:hypothetical protein
VAWLQRDRAGVQPAQRLEELLGVLLVRASEGGSWTRSGPSRDPSPLHLLEEYLEQHVGGDEALVVRDRARHLDRESELRRHRGGPPLVDAARCWR